MTSNYRAKYIKYKTKYLDLKNANESLNTLADTPNYTPEHTEVNLMNTPNNTPEHTAVSITNSSTDSEMNQGFLTKLIKNIKKI